MNPQSTQKLNSLLKKTDFDDVYTAELLSLGLDCLSDLVDSELRVLSVNKMDEIMVPACASQKVHGPVNACALLLGEMNALRVVAEAYAGSQFIETDEDALDADCELINCINGLFTRRFQAHDMTEEMEPPFFREGKSVIKGDAIYTVTIRMVGVQVIFAIAHNTGIEGI